MSKITVDFRTCEVHINNRLPIGKYSKLLNALDDLGDAELTALFEVKKDKPEAKAVPEPAQTAVTAQSMIRPR